MASGARADVVEAFDINDVANDVYEHNFGHRPCQVRRFDPKIARGLAKTNSNCYVACNGCRLMVA